MTIVLVVLFALLLAAIAAVVYAVGVYNALVAVKHQVDQAWSNVDVLLKQRHDELPKLIDAVKGYLAHERALLERITELRARTETGGAGAERLAAEDALSRGVGRLLATAEAYPDLKSSANFVELQRRIAALEEQIAHRREFYNAAVNLNNVRMEQFPDLLLAGAAGLQQRSLFEAQEEERADVDVGARLRS
jgi:LemA protein